MSLRTGRSRSSTMLRKTMGLSLPKTFKFHNGLPPKGGRKGFRMSEESVNAVVRNLQNKFAPKKRTAQDRATRALIRQTTEDVLYNLDKPLNNNELSNLEERVMDVVWQKQVDPLADSLAINTNKHESNQPYPLALHKSRRASRSSANLASARSGLGSRAGPSARGSARAGSRRGSRMSANGSAIMSSRSSLDSGRQLLYNEPNKVLQVYYKLLEEDKVVAKKAKARNDYQELKKVLDWQVAEQRKAAAKREKEDAEAIAAEYKKADELAARIKKDEEDQRRKRVLEFKERAAERDRVLAEKERQRQAHFQREAREVEVAIAREKAVQAAKARKKQLDRKRLVASLDSEVQRIRAIRERTRALDGADVDPEVVEAERQKLIQRTEMEERRKLEYVKANIRRQQVAASATQSFRKPFVQKQQRQEELEEKWVQEQIKYWQDDLKQREVKKKKLEDERLAIVTRQIEENRRKDALRRQEEAKEVARIDKTENFVEEQLAATQKKKARDMMIRRAGLEEQIKAKHRGAPRTAFEKLDELSRAEIEAIKKDPSMLQRIKAKLAAQPKPSGSFLPSSGS